MPFTAAELAAAAHVKRLGKGVTPSAVGEKLYDASIGWSFSSTFVPPGGGASEEMQIRHGGIDTQAVREFDTTHGGL